MRHPIQRMLVVEDDLALQPMWSVILSRHAKGASLDWAVSCEEALRMLRATHDAGESYDLIVTDLFLAGSMTGIDLLQSQEVSRSEASQILVSVAEKEGLDRYQREVPGATIIAKPLNVVKCEMAIQSILNAGEF